MRMIKRGVIAAALAFLAVAGTAGSARADGEPELVLPAGQACDFELKVDIVGGQQVIREFFDRNGNLVRLLSAGKGSELTFTNAETGSQVMLQSNGSVSNTTINPDGTQTVSATGHNVLIFFPTDVPAGPSTTLYVGRVVYTVDADFVFTLEGSSGPKRDICAELS